jgi:uncharacterized protein
MMQRVLLDTGFLLAVFFPRDQRHRDSLKLMRAITGEHIIPAPVLPELFWLMTSERINMEKNARYARAVEIIGNLQSTFDVEPLNSDDMSRMTEIMQKFADSRFDYVDVATMSLSERLNITTIYTLDPDFRRFRPRHTELLTTLPGPIR